MLIESDGISNGYQNRLAVPGVMIADQPFPQTMRNTTNPFGK